MSNTSMLHVPGTTFVFIDIEKYNNVIYSSILYVFDHF